MGSFATDQSVCRQDLELLTAAAGGDKRALRAVCDRFKVPVVAVALRAVRDLDRAFDCVEPVLGTLCRGLLGGTFPPGQWALRAVASVNEHSKIQELQPAEASLLDGLGSIPRVARRRIVRSTLPELPLPELTALLLRYIERIPPGEMIGLVAESEAQVHEKLFAGYQLVGQASEAQRPGRDPLKGSPP